MQTRTRALPILLASTKPKTLSNSSSYRRRNMTNDTTKNAAGLTSQESKALQERQPTDSERPIINALKELYGCKAKEVSS